MNKWHPGILKTLGLRPREWNEMQERKRKGNAAIELRAEQACADVGRIGKGAPKQNGHVDVCRSYQKLVGTR